MRWWLHHQTWCFLIKRGVHLVPFLGFRKELNQKTRKTTHLFPKQPSQDARTFFPPLFQFLWWVGGALGPGQAVRGYANKGHLYLIALFKDQTATKCWVTTVLCAAHCNVVLQSWHLATSMVELNRSVSQRVHVDMVSCDGDTEWCWFWTPPLELWVVGIVDLISRMNQQVLKTVD